MRHVPDSERRSRLARRHALAPGHRHADVVTATGWLDGVRIVNPYQSQQMKGVSL